jgi:transposase InsO family protein
LRRQRGHGVVLLVAAEEVFNWKRRQSRDELRLASVTWIERTYHRRRRQPALGKLTPIENETINSMAKAA